MLEYTYHVPRCFINVNIVVSSEILYRQKRILPVIFRYSRVGHQIFIITDFSDQIGKGLSTFQKRITTEKIIWFRTNASELITQVHIKKTFISKEDNLCADTNNIIIVKIIYVINCFTFTLPISDGRLIRLFRYQ